MNRPAPLKSRYDAVVVGARVAGASTALLLARAGLSVLAVDRSARGSDTTSTHALMRPGLMQLHRWGVLERIVAAGTPPIRRTTFHYGGEAVEVPIQARDGVDALYAPRRTVLDRVLADAAAEAGAHVVYNAVAERLVREASGRVSGVHVTDASGVTRRVEAHIVIGADGARSAVARAVNAPILRAGRHLGVVIYGYWRGLPLDGTHWYFGKDIAAGAIPTNDGRACVFVAMRPERYEAERAGGLERLYGQGLVETDAALARRVVAAERDGKLHPFPGRAGFIRQPWGAGWALAGDAECFKDPITAHGMSDALRDAELLADAVVAGTDRALAAYQATRDVFAVEFLELSDEIASFDWDLERIKVLHHRLSRLMGREEDLVRSLDGVWQDTEAEALA
jgi:2-polyprenyl-6-methoxyphenol hydroxylase-like FAD-dependent oxidoreductase